MRHRIVLLMLLAVAPVGAAEPELPPREIYKKTLAGTVWVIVPTGATTFDIGTGWVADRARKLVVTSFHHVGTREKARLLFPSYDGKRLVTERDHYLKRARDGDTVGGTLLDVDPKRDLALIEVDSLPDGVIELKLAEEAPEPGDRLHAIGNAGESKGQWLYITGTVRQVYRKRAPVVNLRGVANDLDARVIESHMAANPGDSGGPVVDDRGRVVGLTTSIDAKTPTVTTCVSVEDIRAFLKESDQARAAKTADELNARGIRSFDRGLWARAEADFTAALKLEPKKANAYRNRAWTHLRRDDYQKGIEDFTRAVELLPNDATFRNDRGFAHLKKSQLAEALADFTAAIELDPKYALAHNNRGFVRAKKRDFVGAIADYSEALKLNPNSESAYHNRGLAHLDAGDPAKAIADFTEAIRLAPRFAAAYADRARAHDASQNPDRAKADRSKAAELDPSSVKK